MSKQEHRQTRLNFVDRTRGVTTSQATLAVTAQDDKAVFSEKLRFRRVCTANACAGSACLYKEDFVQGKIRNFILLSCDIHLINDDPSLLLYPSYISHDFRELVLNRLYFLTSKQNNNYRKFDFSTGRLLNFDKPRYTELLIPIKYILKSNKQLQLSTVRMNLCYRDCSARYKYDCRLRQEFKSLKMFCTNDKEIITIERSFTIEQVIFELGCSNGKEKTLK